MKTRLLAALFFLLSSSMLLAQELTVNSFYLDGLDITASVHQKNDANGEPCALVKLGLTVPGATFEGDIIAFEQKDGEYWIYMIDGAKWLTIKTNEFVPLRYDFKEPVQKVKTYVMQVTKPNELQRRLSLELKPQVVISGLNAPKSVKFDMLLVNNGMFKMGGTPEQQNSDKDEQPVHWVKITKDFYMGETEVTQALWEYVMKSNPSTFKAADKPVEMVTWDECQDFIRRLNELTGAHFRLPTESEWEYVARGGNKTVHNQYSGSNTPDEIAWYYPNSQNNTHPVKTKKPNELGFYDMSGNVWEMCQDYKNEYPSGEVSDPVGSKPDKNRVRRGGGWDSESASELRTAFRRRVEQDMRIKSLGFRLAMDIQ